MVADHLSIIRSQACIKRSSWGQRKVIFLDMSPFKIGSIHMQFL